MIGSPIRLAWADLRRRQLLYLVPSLVSDITAETGGCIPSFAGSTQWRTVANYFLRGAVLAHLCSRRARDQQVCYQDLPLQCYL